MGQVLHPQASTTEATRKEILYRQESIAKLAKRFGINPKTVAKWKRRDSVKDSPMGPKKPRSTVLTQPEQAMILAFRTMILLSLDDCPYALQETIPHLTRASLQRLIAAVPYQIHSILTDIGNQFTQPANTKRRREQGFDTICVAQEIQHRLTKPCHPWTNWPVERMHRTIKDQTMYRYFYQTHSQLRQRFEAFIQAYNFANRLRALQGRSPYEYICDKWRGYPDIFHQHPHRLTARLIS